MKQLQRAKVAMLDSQALEDGSNSSTESETSETGSARRVKGYHKSWVKYEGRQILDAWEEAITEKVKFEQFCKEKVEEEKKAEEQRLKEAFLKQKRKEYEERKSANEKLRKKVESELGHLKVSPEERAAASNCIMAQVIPRSEDDEIMKTVGPSNKPAIAAAFDNAAAASQNKGRLRSVIYDIT